jgi:hypothetical protein
MSLRLDWQRKSIYDRVAREEKRLCRRRFFFLSLLFPFGCDHVDRTKYVRLYPQRFFNYTGTKAVIIL